MKYKNYAKKLTKKYLVDHGIDIKFDAFGLPKIYYNNKEISCNLDNNSGYFKFMIFSLDKDGNRIKQYPRKGTKKYEVKGWYGYKCEPIVLSRAIYAWIYDKVDDGMVVDHINNKHDTLEDYKIENLQLLTVRQNVTKKTNKNTKKVITKKRHDYYELYHKIQDLKAEYERLLKLGNKYYVNEIKSVRSSLAYYRAILRGLGYDPEGNPDL